MEESTDTADESVNARRLPLAGAVAIVAAITANVVIYLLARAVGAIPDDLPADAEQLGIPAIVIVSILTISVATLALALFARFSAHPIQNFRILSIIVFITSVSAPTGIEDASIGLVVSLLIMHVVTAVIAVLVLSRLSGSD